MEHNCEVLIWWSLYPNLHYGYQSEVKDYIATITNKDWKFIKTKFPIYGHDEESYKWDT